MTTAHPNPKTGPLPDTPQTTPLPTDPPPTGDGPTGDAPPRGDGPTGGTPPKGDGPTGEGPIGAGLPTGDTPPRGDTSRRDDGPTGEGLPIGDRPTGDTPPLDGGRPQDEPLDEGPPQEGPPQEGPPQEAPPQEGPLDEERPHDGLSRDGLSHDGPSHDGPPHDGPPARSVLRDPGFLRLWTGTTASGLATWALPFVLGLAVLDRTLTAPALGLLLAARTAGFLIAVAVGGVLADRHTRRGVVLVAGLAAAAAAPLLALGLGRSLPLMAFAAALAGAGQGACRPAFQALTAEIVAPAQRQQANAATTLAVRVTTLTGPALTALLAVLLDTATLLLGIGLLWLAAALLPGKGTHRPATATPADPAHRPSLRAEFLDGLREARRHPWFLAGLGALTTVIATGYSATGVALPLLSRDRYGTEVVLAAAMTAYTLGALGGALLMARWRPRSQGRTALLGLACYGFAPLALMLPVHPAVIIAAYVLAGIGIELFNVPWFTATQREVAPDKLARVSSLDFLLSYGLAPLGLALIAPAITAFGSTPVLAVCAGLCFLAPAAAALAPGARHFSAPRAPAT